MKRYAGILLVLFFAGCLNTVFDHVASSVERIEPSQGERFVVGTMYTKADLTFSEGNVSVLYPNLTLAETKQFGQSSEDNIHLYDVDAADADGDGNVEVFACGRHGQMKVGVWRLGSDDSLTEVLSYTNDTGGYAMSGVVYGAHYAYASYDSISNVDTVILHHTDFTGSDLENLTTTLLQGYMVYSMATGEQDEERVFVIGGRTQAGQGYLSVWNVTATDGWVEKASTTLDFRLGAFSMVKSVDLFDLDGDGGFEVLVSGNSIYDPVEGFGATNFMGKRGGFLGVFEMEDLSETARLVDESYQTVVMEHVKGVDTSLGKEVMVTGWESDSMADMYDRIARLTPINQTRGVISFYGYEPGFGLFRVYKYATASEASFAASAYVDDGHIYTVGSGAGYTKYVLKRLERVNVTTEGDCTPFTSNQQTISVDLYPLYSSGLSAYARDSCNQTNQTSVVNITIS